MHDEAAPWRTATEWRCVSECASTSGLLARVRAKATRCAWPTDSSLAGLEDRPGSRSANLSRLCTSSSLSFLPLSCGP
jgi:hypothetical protein